MSVDAFINSSSGVFLGARTTSGGCNIQYADGVFCWLLAQGTVRLTGNYSKLTLPLNNLNMLMFTFFECLDQSKVFAESEIEVRRFQWMKFALSVSVSYVRKKVRFVVIYFLFGSCACVLCVFQESEASCWVSGEPVLTSSDVTTSARGFVSVGVTSFDSASFDNLRINASTSQTVTYVSDT